ncbi:MULTISPECIES: nitric oxide reductase transcriptional regulator NorR [unclassified Pseudoalteromonas]|uniref:nitric oxide reductase transcriptional regulator NorR n=1 Tax=unclassified Pseudoalteromonas TaxID=194690 RepID=UPI00301433A7
MNGVELSKLLELSTTLSAQLHCYEGEDVKPFAELLLHALANCIDSDAVAVLQGNEHALAIVACHGLSSDAIGREFMLSEQPRLAAITHAQGMCHFAADSELPDPYDGLLLAASNRLPVHACMGFRVVADNSILAVTFDSLQPQHFAAYSRVFLQTLQHIVEHASKQLIQIITLKQQLRSNTAQRPHNSVKQQRLIGESAVMLALKNEIAMVADSEFNVLIQGDTGTGKELVAKRVHELSQRAKSPFVQVNCAALPDSIAESELFGHTKGAFTGADKARQGKFMAANGGTLFLDEVGELSLNLQSKLLRALQGGEVQAVGSDRVDVVDVRVVAATNRDLQRAVAAGKFRADLFHRLSVYPLLLPTLSQRLDDVPLLVGYFLERLRTRLNVNQVVMAKAALNHLLQHDWPGNVRELEHYLSRAALKAKHQQWQADIIEIQQQHLEPFVAATASTGEKPQSIALSPQSSMKAAVEQLQKQLISQTMQSHHCNWSAAARALQMDRANLVRLAKRLGIDVKKQLQ